MKFIDRLGSVANHPFRWTRLVCLVGLFVGEGGLARAQSIEATPPAPSAPPPGLQPAGPDDTLFSPAAPFQFGFVPVRPHAFYRLTRNDGIQTRPGQGASSTVSSLSVGLAFEIGRHWSADYTPTWTMYSNEALSDSVSHTAVLNGQASFTDGTIDFAQQYSLSNTPLIETGRQTRQETSVTSLAVNYALGQKSRLEVSLSQNARFVSDAPNSTDWTMQNWVHYQFSERVDGAAGLGLGYVSVDPGTDMSFVRPNVRLAWRATNKISMDVHVGAEKRKFRKSGSADLNSPNYGAGVFYQPFTYTTLSLSGQRGVNVSYFANQVTENTSWSLGFNQRLLTRFNFNASASRSTARYIPIGQSTIFTARDDTSYSYNMRLGTSFLRRGTIGLVYQRTRNSSDASGYGFSSNQYGLEIGYRY